MSKRINLHLYPSSLQNASRMEKISSTIEKTSIFDEIHLVGTTSPGRQSERSISERVVVRLLGPENPQKGFWGKVGTFLSWYRAVIAQYGKQALMCVNAHSLSSLPLAWLLKKRSGGMLIYDTHELETETQTARGVRKLLARIVERLFVAACDHVFVVSESIADWYQQRYRIARPSVVLNAPVYQRVSCATDLRATLGVPDDATLFLYQGVFGRGRGIELLLDTFKSIDDNVALLLLGYGPLEQVVIGAADESPKVFFHPAVPPNQLIHYTTCADVGIALIQNICLSYYYSMPNKLFEYLMAGLPVLVSNMYDMARFVEENDVGAVIETESVDAIGAAIRRLNMISDEKLTERIDAVRRTYNWDNQQQTIKRVYRDLFVPEGSGS